MNEALLFAATSDVSGKVRGKAFPLSALEKRLGKGIGWTPTNVMISCFDGIAEGPFGSLGDLVLIPDPNTRIDLDLGEVTERVMLGDIRELDGTAWSCCTRSILKAAIARLTALTGLHLNASFEHEFQLVGAPDAAGEAFSLQGFSHRRQLGERIMGALRDAGMQPDTFMREFGADQYEVTIDPKDALRAADEATLLREIVRLVARAEGQQASFSPIREPSGVGNGVHIHFSFVTNDGRPATWDPAGPNGLSEPASAFAAGILKYLPTLVAFTAPSEISYLRLTPHRWSAAYNNLGDRDRESSLRICPVTAQEPEGIAKQFNLEYRAADAAASPYLALAALLHAGCQGIEEALACPAATQEDLSVLPPEALTARGIERLPETLEQALSRLEQNETVRGWFAPVFSEVYLAHKRGELAELEGRESEARCRAYLKVY